MSRRLRFRRLSLASSIARSPRRYGASNNVSTQVQPGTTVKFKVNTSGRLVEFRTHSILLCHVTISAGTYDKDMLFYTALHGVVTILTRRIVSPSTSASTRHDECAGSSSLTVTHTGSVRAWTLHPTPRCSRACRRVSPARGCVEEGDEGQPSLSISRGTFAPSDLCGI